MSWAGRGKYLISILTLFVFVSSEYAFFHHKVTVVDAAGSSPSDLKSTSSSSTPEDSHPIPTAVLVTDHTASSDTSSSFSQTVPTPTPTSIPLPTPTPALTLTPAVSKAILFPTLVPTATPDCMLHGNNGCGIIGQTVGKVKQVKQSTTNIIKPLGL